MDFENTTFIGENTSNNVFADVAAVRLYIRNNIIRPEHMLVCIVNKLKSQFSSLGLDIQISEDDNYTMAFTLYSASIIPDIVLQAVHDTLLQEYINFKYSVITTIKQDTSLQDYQKTKYIDIYKDLISQNISFNLIYSMTKINNNEIQFFI